MLPIMPKIYKENRQLKEKILLRFEPLCQKKKKEDSIQMVNKYMKKCAYLVVIGKVTIKNNIKYQHSSIRRAKIRD